MSRIVVQRATPGAARLLWFHLMLAGTVAPLTGCAKTVRMVPDLRPRPCGAVIDQAGATLDRSRISWTSPEDGGERAQLEAWCGTVGPAVVYEPPPIAPARADRLAIIGWNVHLGAGDIVRLMDDVRGGRVAGVPAGIPLVLMLQETFRSGDQVPTFVPGTPVPHRVAPDDTVSRRGAIDVAAALGLNAYYLPAMRNGRGIGPDAREDRGLAILSSVPLSHLLAIELPFEHQRRPAAAATIELETVSGEMLALRLVNVHLDSRSGARRLWLASPYARNRQGKALTALLDDSVPTVLQGDLNTWANREPVLEHLDRSFNVCTDRRPTFSAGLRLDWFFARLPAGWTLTCRRLEQKYGSDHYPIVGVLEQSTGVRRPKL